MTRASYPNVSIVVRSALLGRLSDAAWKRVKLQRRLYKQWDGMCIVCGCIFESVEHITIDHIVPVSRGGKNSDNIAPAHSLCNSLKGNNSLCDAIKKMDSIKSTMTNKQFLWWVHHRKKGENISTYMAKMCYDAKRTVRLNRSFFEIPTFFDLHETLPGMTNS